MKVREVVRLLESGGWFLQETRGSHRQYNTQRWLGVLQGPESYRTILLREL